MKKSILFLIIVLSSYLGFSQGADITFIQTATASNISGVVTYIDHPLLDNNPSAKIFITHSIAGDGSITYNSHKTGVYYSAPNNKWGIYNEDNTPMLLSSTYNVLIPGTGSDVVEVVSNGGNYWTIIDDPALNNKPNLHPILTHRYTDYQDHNYSMYYASSNKWGILCDDGATEIPAGEVFFVLAKPSDTGYNVDMSFKFSPTTDDFSNGTFIDHPLLNNHPEAKILATHSYQATLFDHTLTSYYRPSDSKWVLISEDSPVTFAGQEFNIVISMPAPANDLCDDAVSLTVGGSFGEYVVEGTLLGSDGSTWGDVWYKTTVPATGYITIETAYSSGSPMNDTFITAYKGSCSSLVFLVIDDNSGSGDFSKIALSGLTPGDTLFFKVEEDADTSDPSGTFLISAYDPSLSIADAVIDGFSMYPNPVNDILNIQTANPIKAVSIYNMLGQEMLNTSQNQIDMSALSRGSYIVKVQAGDQIGAYSLIKQ